MKMSILKRTCGLKDQMGYKALGPVGGDNLNIS